MHISHHLGSCAVSAPLEAKSDLLPQQLLAATPDSKLHLGQAVSQNVVFFFAIFCLFRWSFFGGFYSSIVLFYFFPLRFFGLSWFCFIGCFLVILKSYYARPFILQATVTRSQTWGRQNILKFWFCHALSMLLDQSLWSTWASQVASFWNKWHQQKMRVFLMFS